ncbi:MAG: multicopper oxidase domain-containing protein, partial [Methylococcales bacterium]|nr:multicopper oxidase domain-containing protein [Methylococcales bacterium]
NFINDDEIRHQWMIHGLPKYLYPQGMFHIELNGSGTKTGTFIVPNSHFTYLVHCDIAQHMEKGMKAQLKVGNGRGDLPSIPGISDPTFKDNFEILPQKN